MIGPLLLLPPTLLGREDLDDLAGLAAALSDDWVVVVGEQLDRAHRALDPFCVAAALAALRPGLALGVEAAVGAGRVPSLLAREATAAELLGACRALVLRGDDDACADAARIVERLFTPGVHTLATPTASITEAVNDPQPSVEGGPAACWAAGASLRRLEGAVAHDAGEVEEVALPGALPDPRPGRLVVLRHPPASPSALASAIAR